MVLGWIYRWGAEKLPVSSQHAAFLKSPSVPNYTNSCLAPYGDWCALGSPNLVLQFWNRKSFLLASGSAQWNGLCHYTQSCIIRHLLCFHCCFLENPTACSYRTERKPWNVEDRQLNFWLGRGGTDPTANTGYCLIFQELGKLGKKNL